MRTQVGMQHLLGKKLYISGPMKGQEDNGKKAFTDACEELRALGWEVVSPHELGLNFPPDQDCDPDAYYNECLRLDLLEMLHCNAICLLDNWWTSKGVMIELNAAIGCGLKVVRYLPTVGVLPA